MGTSGVKICDKPAGCMAAGEVCWEGQASNCCPQGASGGNKLCLPTDIGVRRCFAPETSSQCVAEGQTCSFGDECCSGICLPGPNGYVCAAQCVALNGVCTADADCCDGVCEQGTCHPSETSCEPLGAGCDADTDCCGGHCDLTLKKCAVTIK